ncbi:MAG TPA: magnesium/cobalt transporter CorA [Nitrospiria bacterium]
MAKRLKKRSKREGLPPGTLIHVGEKRTERVRIRALFYDGLQIEEREVQNVREIHAYQRQERVMWIQVIGIHDSATIEELGNAFGLHPLVMEDILHTGQRPKMEDYGNYIFIVLKMFAFHSGLHELEEEQISVVLGSNFVISFQEREEDCFNPVRERIQIGKGKIRKMGADYLAYCLIDAVVDRYFTVLDSLGEMIETVEGELIEDPTTKTIYEIHKLKREMIFLRKSIWPLREVLGALERGDSSLFMETTGPYLRDVYDHTIRVIDMIETFRDMLSGMLDIYLSSVSNRMNAIMKVLTLIATVFMPLTFIAGIYGMNFKSMPELEWKFGYPLSLIVMAIVGVSMVVFFKRKKWLS